MKRKASFRHSRLSRLFASGDWDSPTSLPDGDKRACARFSILMDRHALIGTTWARDWEGKEYPIE